MAVKFLTLMKSELKPTGSVYTKLWEARVGEKLSPARFDAPTRPH